MGILLKLRLLGVTIETSHHLQGIEIHFDFYYWQWSLVTPSLRLAEEAIYRSTIKRHRTLIRGLILRQSEDANCQIVFVTI